MNVRFTPRALKQIESIGRFIAQDDAHAAEVVTGRIRALCLLLGDHPYMGHPSNIPSVRTLGMPRDPYRISLKSWR